MNTVYSGATVGVTLIFCLFLSLGMFCWYVLVAHVFGTLPLIFFFFIFSSDASSHSLSSLYIFAGTLFLFRFVCVALLLSKWIFFVWSVCCYSVNYVAHRNVVHVLIFRVFQFQTQRFFFLLCFCYGCLYIIFIIFFSVYMATTCRRFIIVC